MCQDFVSNDAASTTLVQRSATCLTSLKTSTAQVMGNYPEGCNLENADLFANSLPPRLAVELSAARIGEAKKADAELHQGLRDKGFELTWTHKGVEASTPLFIYEKFAGSTNEFPSSLLLFLYKGD